jgi:TetR/AcrR family transcriptional regulator, transcriptional repressor for nem operon
MRYAPAHKEEARSRILSAAGRGFRRLGYGGIGVDGLAKEAGVTSGAFYGHFPSKAEAFKASAVAGLVELREAIEQLQVEQGDAWLKHFTEFYLSVRRTCDLGESCGLQSMTPEVVRADDDTKAAYEAKMLKVVDAVAAGLRHGTSMKRHQTAWAILSLLSGSVTLARSAPDPKIGAQIVVAVSDAIALLDGF